MRTDTVTGPVLRITVAVIVVDQLTKLVGMLNVGGVFLPVRNPDYSLGVVAGPTIALVAVSALTLVAAARYGIGLVRNARIPAWVPGAVIGGAASNLADRVILGSVRDFIPTPVAIVNVADLAVLAGVAVYLGSVARRSAPARASA